MNNEVTFIMFCGMCKKKFRTKGTNVKHCGKTMIPSTIEQIVEKKPSIWECVVCRERFIDRDCTLSHCDKLTQWISEAEAEENEKIDIKEKIVKVLVGGYITMKEKDYNIVMGYDDPHTGIIMSIGTFSCTDNLIFNSDEK